ncbi:hypothetical protein [Cupriavidus necator]|uniref:hypothetical protein n=1 Tax=Cupriavidus necator TaxID=106590 RepID=UPI00339D5663
MRASTDCRVNIERNVEVMGNEGQMAYLRTVATVQKSLAARKGDTLTLVDADGQPIPGESYVIDSPAFEDNGFTARYVLRSA